MSGKQARIQRKEELRNDKAHSLSMQAKKAILTFEWVKGMYPNNPLAFAQNCVKFFNAIAEEYINGNQDYASICNEWANNKYGVGVEVYQDLLEKFKNIIK